MMNQDFRAPQAREIQDVILTTRKQAVRVPEWFYARFRDADEQDFQTNANHLRGKLTKSQRWR
jgi:hypothetical protein